MAKLITKSLLPWLEEFSSWVSRKTGKYNALFRLFSAAFPGIGAVILVYMRDGIKDSTHNMRMYWSNPSIRENYSVDYWVISYFVITFLWVIAYILFVINDFNDTKNKAEQARTNNEKNIAENRVYLTSIKDELSSAIHNAPNPEIFKPYKVLTTDIFQDLQDLDKNLKLVQEKIFEGKATANDQIAFYNLTFKSILDKISKFTKVFSTKDAVYGANIMYYIHRTTATEQELINLRGESSWIYFKVWDIHQILGVLRSIPELIHSSDNDKLKVPPVVIAIAVKWKNEDDNPEDKKEILIPSAGSAAVLGEYVVNTADIYNKTDNNLNDLVRAEAKEFFSTIGKDIKSVASFGIPVSGKTEEELKAEKLPIVIGVLNIDCSDENLIGTDERYNTTYFSFIKPIVYLFAPYLQNYLTLLNKEKIAID